jgi:hypothetical protein
MRQCEAFGSVGWGGAKGDFVRLQNLIGGGIRLEYILLSLQKELNVDYSGVCIHNLLYPSVEGVYRSAKGFKGVERNTQGRKALQNR